MAYPSNHVVAYKAPSGLVRQGMVELMNKAKCNYETVRKIAAFRCMDGSIVETSTECRERNFEYKCKRFVRNMLYTAGRLSIEARITLRKELLKTAEAKYANILTGHNVNSIY